ncbi:N-acetylmuramoyl-L-alanine amidase [Bacillus cereus]|uniref:N-acetylmuramoyl-L-alanine amidase n=1 Tax=Bacillus cereus group TaxID=86661 RepID=UPI000BF9A26A|nr:MULTISPECIES: N-acetylmuramoyl-L-alanine amidase [Bacillus cereus group]MBJ8127504.1 N-acetylmuramoyl-L-alanine amidase [Bacillus cereus]PFE92697.1 N-acetylmuramoyl-L-alanine amidase [Bacillus thuringiensis]
MARYSNHGGHNAIVQGANWGNRKEHIMDRQVKDAVTTKLRALGHTVYDDTDEVGRTQAQNLNNIVANCNSHAVDLVISYHLNASDGNGHGVEVLYFDQKDLAAKVSAQLAKDIGWRDRGAKQRTDLAVLRGTKAPAILIELGFIDNDDDMAKWNVDKIANSIVYALTGQTVGDGGGNSGSNGGYQYVKSGGFGVSLVPEVLNAMNERGIKGKVISDPLTGVAYLETEVLPNTELDKITWWMDNRPVGKWFYEYFKK